MDSVFHNIRKLYSNKIVMFCFKLNPSSILSRVLRPAFARARNSLTYFMSDSNFVHVKSKNVTHPPALVDLDIRHKLSAHQVSELYQKFLVGTYVPNDLRIYHLVHLCYTLIMYVSQVSLQIL